MAEAPSEEVPPKKKRRSPLQWARETIPWKLNQWRRGKFGMGELVVGASLLGFGGGETYMRVDDFYTKNARSEIDKAINNDDIKAIIDFLKGYSLEKLGVSADRLLDCAILSQTATEEEQCALAKFALNNGAVIEDRYDATLIIDRNQSSFGNCSPVCVAILNEQNKLLQVLLENMKTEEKQKVTDGFLAAANIYDATVIRQLLDAGVPIVTPNPNVNTPEIDYNFSNAYGFAVDAKSPLAAMLFDAVLLHVKPGSAGSWKFDDDLIRHGDFQSIRRYVEAGFKPGSFNMLTAVQRNDKELVELLLRHGVEPNVSGAPLGMGRDPEILNLLMDNGADPNQRIAYTMINCVSPLNSHSTPEVAETLIRKGANIYTRNVISESRLKPRKLGSNYIESKVADEALIQECQDAFSRMEKGEAPKDVADLYLMLAAFPPDDARAQSNPPKTAKDFGTIATSEYHPGDDLTQIADTEAMLKFLFSHVKWENLDQAKGVAQELLEQKRIGHAFKESLIKAAEQSLGQEKAAGALR